MSFMRIGLRLCREGVALGHYRRSTDPAILSHRGFGASDSGSPLEEPSVLPVVRPECPPPVPRPTGDRHRADDHRSGVGARGFRRCRRYWARGTHLRQDADGLKRLQLAGCVFIVRSLDATRLRRQGSATSRGSERARRCAPTNERLFVVQWRSVFPLLTRSLRNPSFTEQPTFLAETGGRVLNSLREMGPSGGIGGMSLSHGDRDALSRRRSRKRRGPLRGLRCAAAQSCARERD